MRSIVTRTLDSRNNKLPVFPHVKSLYRPSTLLGFLVYPWNQLQASLLPTIIKSLAKLFLTHSLTVTEENKRHQSCL